MRPEAVSPDQFLEIFDRIPEAYLLLAGDGKILAANRRSARTLGLPHGTKVGKSLLELVSDPATAVRDSLRTWATTGEMLPCGLRVAGTDGQTVRYRAEGALLRPRSDREEPLLLVRFIPQRQASSQFLLLNQRIEELNREIRQRRSVEDELRAQREWLQVTLRSIGDAVIATDAQRRVTFMNPVAERLTGWSQEEAGGRPLEEVFHIVNEETRREVDSPVAKVLRLGTIQGLANHTVLISRDGTERPIDDCAAPIRNGEERLRGVVLVFHDVSDRREYERELKLRAQKLEEADRKKDEFIAMLAHELRNPLAAIRYANQLAALPELTEREGLDVPEMIEHEVTHLARLIDDLLDISRITRGKVWLKKEPVDALLVARRAASALRPRLDAKQQIFQLAVADGPLPVEADPIRLQQVLENLLANASKYTPEGRQIVLEAVCESGEAVLRVRDEGIGIPPEMLVVVFEPFTQLGQSLDRKDGGLGIGLTLVRSLVELHGGTVTAHSEGLGQGSTFVVRLPLAEPAAEATRHPEHGPDSSPLRVLIVEDNVPAATMLKMLLAGRGHRVALAHDGLRAVQIAGDFRPDVVILDIGLPTLDGYQVAERLRRDEATKNVTIIGVSGYGQEQDRERSRRAGFDHHLVKPCTLANLLPLMKTSGAEDTSR